MINKNRIASIFSQKNKAAKSKVKMMPPPSAANDVFVSLGNDAARFARNDAMFANAPKAASSAKRHHVRRTHHLPDRANIIEDGKFYNLPSSGGA